MPQQQEYAAHEERYYAVVKYEFHLQPTAVPTVFRDSEGNHIRVPLPFGKTPAQCEEQLEKIREQVAWLT